MTVAILRSPQPARALQSELRWSHDRTFDGHVVDPASPERRYAVELLVDGFVVGCCLANQPAVDLTIGDGCYGFSFALGAELLDEASVVEARLANLGLAVGEPVLLRQGVAARPVATVVGAVRWLGGLRFTGWIAEDEGPVDIVVDGEHVAEIPAGGWAHIGDAADARAVRAFDYHLPERFADGAAHRLIARDARGRPLADTPQPFLAFAGGLARGRDHAPAEVVLRDDLRAEMFDKLVPMSVPFADYRRWRGQLPASDVPSSQRVIAVICTGAGDVDATVASLNAQSHHHWVAAALGARDDDVSFDPAGLREFLFGDGAEADLVLALPAGTTLAPDALARIAAAFDDRPETAMVYCDLEVAGEDGSLWPLALPTFDYDRLLEQGYCCHLFALRREAAEGGLNSGADSLYRMFNALLDHDGEAARGILHLPLPLGMLPPIDLARSSPALAAATAAHLRHRWLRAEVTVGEGRVLPAVRVRRAAAAGVSVIIPTRNRGDLLRACIETIRPSVRRADGEILVVDNDSSDPAALAYLDDIDGREARVIRAPGPFNFSRLNNLAAAEAKGNHLCLLNNDVEAMDDSWLDEMLGRIAEPDVGAVGATLLWPSGVVQHAGVVLGPNFAAAHIGNDRLDGDAGYGDMLRVARQCGAVTAACLLTRRSDYLAVGGLDEDRFPVNFNDVDYCLKLRAIGRRVVVTPHARLLHRESASRGTDKSPDRKARLERELRNLRGKWGDALVNDPFYSPMLSLDAVPFSALAWPLRPLDQRTAAPPVAVTVPSGF